MRDLLHRFLRLFIRKGNVRVTTSDGATFVLGDGTGKPIAMRFTSRAAELGVLLDPDLRFGEAYMDGTLVFDEGSIADVIEVAMSQEGARKVPQWARYQGLARQLLELLQFGGGGAKRTGLVNHYDRDGKVYSFFLDSEQHLSCAYYPSLDLSLDDAQLAKKRHIAAKLLIKPDIRVLDIGSGWGGLDFYLATIGHAKVTGITLSKELADDAAKRAAERGLQDRVEFRAQDFRSITGVFDRIVSVETIEHIGRSKIEPFFHACARHLADDGVIVIQVAGRPDGPELSNAFISKYFFPHAYAATLSELLPMIERAGLVVTDIETLHRHYPQTIRENWRKFREHKAEIEKLYDAKFYRMWEFWFAATAFGSEITILYQLQLAKRRDAVPMTRDYMFEEEARLRGLDGGVVQRPAAE